MGFEERARLAPRRLRMTRYQLAKIVDWAGTLDTRKRMQKVVYLLSGGRLSTGYRIYPHHYRPLFARGRPGDRRDGSGQPACREGGGQRGRAGVFLQFRRAPGASSRLRGVPGGRALACRTLAPISSDWAVGFSEADLKGLESACDGRLLP